MSRVTLRDVASAAGVSIGTASNAFNRPDRLSTDLRERVLAAAAELGYAGPDPSARRLRTGRSGALGLLFTEWLPYAFTDAVATIFLRGVALGLEGTGAGLLIVPASPSADDPAQVVREAAVDGFLIYSTPAGDPRTEAVLARKLPTVTVDQPRSTGTPFVGIDDRAAAAAATAYLRELGHERVAALSFFDSARNEGQYPFDLTLERLAGFRDGLGGTWDPELVASCIPNTAEIGHRATLEALDRPDPPTAIVAMSDALATGALDAARERGIAVPDQLSVVGFDDSPLATLATPQLTSVAQPLEHKGRLAAEQLVAAVEGKEPPAADARTILPHQLIVRGSSGPAPPTT